MAWFYALKTRDTSTQLLWETVLIFCLELRIFIIWFLSTEQEVSRADLEKFEESLKAAGADTTSLAYVKQ